MTQPLEETLVEQLERVNPYGDVALGVECAWPTAEFDLLAQAAQES
jgi:hypothetical protein